MPNPIKPTLKTEIAPILLIAVSVISSFYFYKFFPPFVPTHWNYAGEIDSYGSSFVGAFFLPILIIGIYILFMIIPYMDPKKENYIKFANVYHIFKTAFLAFLTLIYFITSFNGLGINIPVDKSVTILVGILFALIGYYMSDIKYNWFVGIRTPWTMSSDKVWQQTHKVGGIIFMLSGALMSYIGFMPVVYREVSFILIILFILIGTVGYSYYLYSKEKK